jgi:site-specific recombinase XerC
VYTDDLTRDDVTKFHGQMRKRGLADRTVHSRRNNLKSFLIYLELDAKKIAGKAPRFEKTMPEIFEPEELAALFRFSSCRRLTLRLVQKYRADQGVNGSR